MLFNISNMSWLGLSNFKICFQKPIIDGCNIYMRSINIKGVTTNCLKTAQPHRQRPWPPQLQPFQAEKYPD